MKHLLGSALCIIKKFLKCFSSVFTNLFSKKQAILYFSAECIYKILGLLHSSSHESHIDNSNPACDKNQMPCRHYKCGLVVVVVVVVEEEIGVP
jgi:hypothetical protein